jgi:hypothetical protein
MIGDSFFTACVCLSLLSTAATGPLARKFRPIDVELPTGMRATQSHGSFRFCSVHQTMCTL